MKEVPEHCIKFAGITTMASESEASCEEDPNFAVICAFLEKFGETIGITNIDFFELQSMLENTIEVHKYLVDLHVKLLRKIKKSVLIDKWEKSLIKLCHTFSSIDAWEVERFGYKKAKLSSKLRILKELLELQFDYNFKFKSEVNKSTSDELRSQPIGRDKFGHCYWFQSDDNYQIRVYKEYLDDEKWSLVAKDRNDLVALINNLSDGDIKISSDSAGNEDSNSLSDKPVIDTGQQEESKEILDEGSINKVSLKRLRDETEEEKLMFQKYKIKNLEIVVSDITKDPILADAIEDTEKQDENHVNDVPIKIEPSEHKEEKPIIGDEIVEPTLKVEGEGSGVDNQSPIVGEVIEEGVMYFYGQGNGQDCQTGNESETEKNNKEKEETVNENIATNVGLENLENINDSKMSTDNCQEKEEKDVNSLPLQGDDKDALTNNRIKQNNDDTKVKLIENNESEKSTTDNKVVNNKEENANVITVNESKDAVDQNNFEKTTGILDNIEEPIQQTDVNKEVEEDTKKLVKNYQAIEPDCIKNVAYVCGETEELEENKTTNETSAKVELSDVKEAEKREEHTENEKEETGSESINNVCAESNGHENVESPEVKEDDRKTDDEQSKSATRSNSKNSSVQPEAVFVPETKQKSEKSTIYGKKNLRPVRRAVKRQTKMKTDQNDQDPLEKSKTPSSNSSRVNSPTQSAGDSSVTADFTAGDSLDVEAAPESDPLAVSGPDVQELKEPTSAPARTTRSSTLRNFSLDYNDSDSQKVTAVSPPAVRSVRKRGRENTTQVSQEADNGPEKRIKLKGRRLVDTALRKSAEQRIEQLNGSSSESKDSDEEKTSQKANRHKKKSPKSTTPKKQTNKHPEKKNSRILAGLDITEDSSNDRPALRQSRRIAQMKIKEQMDPTPASKLPSKEEEPSSKKKKGKNDKAEKRKRNKYKEDTTSEPEVVVEKKKKKKKEKPVSQLFNENRPWQSSSDDSDDAVEEEEDEDVIEEEDDAPLGELKSDHEFSPESDLEGEHELQPMKRARTAVKDSDQTEIDDFPCQKCGKLDHPEWILLCDKCDNGWHCSCLRPSLLVIPEGDWYCPPCQHIILLEQLKSKLVEYDKKLSKKEIEDRRKERLAYVGISLNNVLPAKESIELRKPKRRHYKADSSSEEVESECSESESASDSDEPIYQLRQRRQAKSYKFNEYDEMMKTAIGEELDKPEDTAGNLGRGKDIQTIVKGLEPEPKAPENGGRNINSLKKMLRKKHRKLSSLEFDSEEEDISDEDFKGSSSDSEDEEDDDSAVSEDSDDCVGRKRRKNAPVRRSTRARTKRYDSDFINDDSEDDAPKRKKKKPIWDESETEESDASGWGEGKKGKKKKKKKSRKDGSEDRKRSKRRIKYGGLTSSDEDLGRGRRTRGKTATYVDTLGSDSEEEKYQSVKRNPRRLQSDDDEDFIANEEEDEEKGSEDNEGEDDEQDEEEEEHDSEQERLEKRSLLVPKIYIKKPLGIKKSDVKAAATTVPNKVLEDPKPVASNDESANPKVNNTVKTEIKSPDPPSLSEPVSDAKLEQGVIKSVAGKEVNTTVKTETPVVVKTETKSDDSAIVVVEPEKPANPVLLSKRIYESRETVEKPEPIVSNVSALIKNLDENDDLSEPPGIALPVFDELSTGSGQIKPGLNQEPHRRRRSKIVPMRKKTLEETLACIGKKIPVTESPAIEIAAPPQPFSQAQPTPSIITRMLQSTPGQASRYPVGTIRPKQFATMRDDDSSDDSPKGSRESSPARPPAAHVPYSMPGGIRGPLSLPFRQQPRVSLNHLPRGPPIRGPPTTLTPPIPRGSMQPHILQGRTHGPPLPSPHGPPTSSHGPPTSLGLPLPSHASPLTTHGPLPSSHPTPPSAHGPPTSNHGPKTISHGLPISHGSPTSTQGPPTSSHRPPTSSHSSHGPPTSSHGPPVSSHIPQLSSHVPSISSHSPSISSHGPPISSHGLPVSTHASPISSHGPPPSSLGPPPSHGLTPPSHGGGPPPSHQYQHHSSHRPMDPSPSGGGPINLADPGPLPPTSSPSVRYPPISQPSPVIRGPPRPHLSHSQSYQPPPPTSTEGPPSEGYYGNYPPPPPSEDAMPPTSYQGPEVDSQYSEQYTGSEQAQDNPPSDNSSSKVYEDESGGEFAGLASYFSSQREDDLES